MTSFWQLKFHPPLFLLLAWWLSWLEVGITGQKFGRGPSKDHSTKVWFKLAQWLQRSWLKCEKLTDGRTDDRRSVVTIAHMTLWVRWANNNHKNIIWRKNIIMRIKNCIITGLKSYKYNNEPCQQILTHYPTSKHQLVVFFCHWNNIHLYLKFENLPWSLSITHCQWTVKITFVITVMYDCKRIYFQL